MRGRWEKKIKKMINEDMRTKLETAVALVTCIREMANSNFGWNTGLSGYDLSYYSPVSPDNCRGNTTNQTTPAFFPVSSN
jgi:hypothetical protein